MNASGILRLIALLPRIRGPDIHLSLRPRHGYTAPLPGLTNDLVTFGLGAPTNAVTALTLPMAKKSYVPNAVDAVRKRSRIREKFDPSFMKWST